MTTLPTNDRDEAIRSILKNARSMGFVFKERLGILELGEVRPSNYEAVIALKESIERDAAETNVFRAAMLFKWTIEGAMIELLAPWVKQEVKSTIFA